MLIPTDPIHAKAAPATIAWLFMKVLFSPEPSFAFISLHNAAPNCATLPSKSVLVRYILDALQSIAPPLYLAWLLVKLQLSILLSCDFPPKYTPPPLSAQLSINSDSII